MKTKLIYAIVVCLGLFSMTANATETRPVDKPIIAYVTDTAAGVVKFIEGNFFCWPKEGFFVISVTDTVFRPETCTDGPFRVQSLVELNDEDSLTESFPLDLFCRTIYGQQEFFATDGVRSRIVVSWLTQYNGFVQFSISGPGSSVLVVLVPCNEHWLGY